MKQRKMHWCSTHETFCLGCGEFLKCTACGRMTDFCVDWDDRETVDCKVCVGRLARATTDNVWPDAGSLGFAKTYCSEKCLYAHHGGMKNEE